MCRTWWWDSLWGGNNSVQIGCLTIFFIIFWVQLWSTVLRSTCICGILQKEKKKKPIWSNLCRVKAWGLSRRRGGFIYLFCIYLFSFRIFFPCFKISSSRCNCPGASLLWRILKKQNFSYVTDDSWKSSLWQKWTANNKAQKKKNKKNKRNKIPGCSLHVKKETFKMGKITQEPGNEVKANTLLL
jgi:hypothetical protein